MIPGGRAKLPYLTQATLGWSHIWGPQLLALGIAAGTLTALWTWRSTLKGTLTAMAGLLLLVTLWFLAVLSCFVPLVSVIQNLEQP